MLLRVFERFNSVSTLLVDLLEYRGHTPSFVEVKNERSFTSTPPTGLRFMFSDNFIFSFTMSTHDRMTRIQNGGPLQHAVCMFWNDIGSCSACPYQYCNALRSRVVQHKYLCRHRHNIRPTSGYFADLQTVILDMAGQVSAYTHFEHF